MDIEGIRENHTTLSERLSRGDESRLAPSRLASQFYCEQKVALTREHGDVPTPAKARGTATHEAAAAAAEPISDEEFWAAMERGDRTVLVESPLVSEAAEFLLSGVPDAVLFDDGKPQLLFERKTTARPDRLYKNQRFQAWLYGYMLDRLGHDTDELTVAILSHEQSLNATIATELQELVLRGYAELAPGSHELTNAPRSVLHLSEFSPVEYVEDLDWALEYWRDEREPIPTTVAGKCRACEYADRCAESQA